MGLRVIIQRLWIIFQGLYRVSMEFARPAPSNSRFRSLLHDLERSGKSSPSLSVHESDWLQDPTQLSETGKMLWSVNVRYTLSNTGYCSALEKKIMCVVTSDRSRMPKKPRVRFALFYIIMRSRAIVKLWHGGRCH